MKNFRRIAAVLMAVILCVGLSACGKKAVSAAQDLENVQKKGKLVVGITEYEPMDYKDDNGDWTGFDAEFARDVAKQLGVEAEFVVIDWDNKFIELNAGSIDCIWNGMTITDEVRANSSVTNAYVKNAQVVVMAKDKLASYTDAASMAGLKFTAESGSAGEQAIKDQGFADYTAVGAQSDALMEVASGSADACVIDITMADSMTGEGTSYADLGYSVELTSEEYGISFRTGSDLTAKVNELMAQMMQDGTLDALADKYQLTLVK